jgi:hypothetical protein
MNELISPSSPVSEANGEWGGPGWGRFAAVLTPTPTLPALGCARGEGAE